jgi:Zn-dependent protease
MGGRAWRVGSIGGVPIRLDSSWIWIAVLYTYFRYVQIRGGGAFVGDRAAIVLAVFSAALFFGSVLTHELAHAATARALGIAVGGITLVFWGGFTETRAEKRGPMGEFLVSAAGPMSSLVLGGGFWAIGVATRGSLPGLSETFRWLGFINVLLAALNSLPGFPLDGGRVFLATVWKLTGDRRTATRAAGAVGLATGTTIAVVSALMLLRGGGDLQFAIYGFFIAWWMISSARSSERHLAVRDALAGGTAADAMQPPPRAVGGEASLSDALDGYLRGHEDESFPVVDAQGRLQGVISFESARKIGSDDPLRPVRDAMVPLSEVRTVEAGDRLDHVFDGLGPGGAALVLDGGRLVGAIRSRDLEAWLNAKRGGASHPPGMSPAAAHVPPRPDR